MRNVRYKDGHVNYSFEAAVGIAYKALGIEWNKIDYIRETYLTYRFENVGERYKSKLVPLYVSKKTGEYCGEKEYEEKRDEKDTIQDFAVSIMNSKLPYPHVHFGEKYFAFSETEKFETCFCSCHKQAIENEIELFERYYQYDCALNDRMQLLLNYHMQMPKIVEDAIRASKIPHGTGLYSLFEYKDNICHLCCHVNPQIHYGMFAKGSKFKQQYSQYVHVKFNSYGLNDRIPDFFGIYFLEEKLPENFKKILIPSLEEVLVDIVTLYQLDHDTEQKTRCELEKIWALPKEERYIVMYWQQMNKILRNRSLLTPYDFCKVNGFDVDIIEQLQNVIWKRFKIIDKIINDEVKQLAKGAK